MKVRQSLCAAHMILQVSCQGSQSLVGHSMVLRQSFSDWAEDPASHSDELKQPTRQNNSKKQNIYIEQCFINFAQQISTKLRRWHGLIMHPHHNLTTWGLYGSHESAIHLCAHIHISTLMPHQSRNSTWTSPISNPYHLRVMSIHSSLFCPSILYWNKIF